MYVEEWIKLSQRFTDRSIDEWSRRLILGLYSSRVDILSTYLYESVVVVIIIIIIIIATTIFMVLSS